MENEFSIRPEAHGFGELFQLSEEECGSRIVTLFAEEDRLLRHDFGKLTQIGGRTIESYQSLELLNKVLAVHKLLFLTGGNQGDVITAKDPWGNFIYTKIYQSENPPNPQDPLFRLNYPAKDAEIDEALHAISSFNQKVKSEAVAWSRASNKKVEAKDIPLNQFLRDPFDLPEVISEVADVMYNLEHVKKLDSAYRYQLCIEEISRSFGFPLQKLLAAAVIKYEFRYKTMKNAKDVAEENRRIGWAMYDGSIPLPTIGTLSLVYDALHEMTNKVIRPRVDVMEYEVDRLVSALRVNLS